mgnify:CR=1 FL=1
MIAYLIQHGTAASKDEDPERPLTLRGRRDVERVADRVASVMGTARVVHSGKLRALQTAEIVAQRLGVEAVNTFSQRFGTQTQLYYQS